jgi:DNA-binding transcriptional MerR regulator
VTHAPLSLRPVIASGHRVYAAQQTRTLKLIKRLIDFGMRLGHLVPLDDGQL